MCFVTYIQTEQECNGTDVRLVDGETEFDGSVEICQNGLWVPVCDDMWNYRKAQIVCEQLGYSGSRLILTDIIRMSVLVSGYYALRQYRDKAVKGLTLMSCQGNETSLRECAFDDSESICNPRAAVMCTSKCIFITNND